MALNLFGFQISRQKDALQQQSEKTFAPPPNEDGALTISAAAYYGTYVDLDGTAKNEVELGRIRLDMDARRCFVDQVAVDLTAREFAVLELLLLRAGRVITRSQILDLLYGWEDNQATNTVEVLVYRLRKKLDFSGWDLKTIRGMGYLLEVHRGSIG